MHAQQVQKHTEVCCCVSSQSQNEPVQRPAASAAPLLCVTHHRQQRLLCQHHMPASRPIPSSHAATASIYQQTPSTSLHVRRCSFLRAVAASRKTTRRMPAPANAAKSATPESSGLPYGNCFQNTVQQPTQHTRMQHPVHCHCQSEAPPRAPLPPPPHNTTLPHCCRGAAAMTCAAAAAAAETTSQAAWTQRGPRARLQPLRAQRWWLGGCTARQREGSGRGTGARCRVRVQSHGQEP